MTATRVPMGQHAARRRSRLSRLSRADLEAQVTKLLDVQSAISEVLRTIASSPNDLQPAFDTIVDNAARLCRSERATMRMVDKEGLLLVSVKLPPEIATWCSPPLRVDQLVSVKLPPEIAASYSPPPLRVDHNSNVGRLAARKSTVHIPNLGEHELFRAEDPATLSWFKGGLRTLILVPMVDNDKTIGLISFGRSRIEPYTEEEIDLITDFGAQAAIALGIIRRERELREMQLELAHANRISTMGQLSSSIAHEVTQPIATARNNTRAAMRFLNKQPPDLGEAREALDCVVADVDRAAAIVGRIRDHFKKAPPKMDRLDMNEAIRDAITLTHGEAVNKGVSIQLRLAEGLPFFRGDRVQIQQVMVNLIVNAIQAMGGASDGRRELQISTEADMAEGVRVGVRDTGPGVTPESLPRLFDPFYTTKAEGMGVGLAICRSIVEGHGGRLRATACEPYGALFQFTIPTQQEAAS
jgi:signal transduction histidine kinase